MRGLALALVSVLSPACSASKEEKARTEMEQSQQRMHEFAEQMCACRDKSCADKVQEAMTTWSTDMAARQRDEPEPSEAVLRRWTEIGQRYGECMTKAMSSASDRALSDPTSAPSPPSDAEPPVESDAPPMAGSPRLADEMLGQARAWAEKHREGRRVSRVTFAYVDRDGVLDAVDGAIKVEFGRVNHQPPRRIGAPVRSHPVATDCFEASNSGGRWVVTGTDACAETIEYRPRCMVGGVWKRALQKHAMGDALAVITLDVKAKRWDFVIEDEAAAVHIHETFDDTCEPEAGQ